jgi:DNA-binding NtrC family response regulator
MRKKTILFIKGRERLNDNLRSLSESLGVEVIQCERGPTAPVVTAEGQVDLVVMASNGTRVSEDICFVKQIKDTCPCLPIIMAVENGSKAHVVASFRAGVQDYVDYPCSGEELLRSIEATLLREEGNPQKFECSRVMVGESRPMLEIFQFINRVASTDSTVLITGETGTGKELVASLVHDKSGRREKPFVCVNCAALPDTLVESEMFGYERGAFTGAVSGRLGKFEVANGGTVFLDEISDMSPFAQAKILRTVESKEIYRLGGRKVIPLDVRVTAATNKDPEELITEGKFREDLYYRINIARIHLPPLRERKEDIRHLIAYGIEKLNRKYHRNIQGLSDEAMTSLMGYEWPGNIRELMNLLEATFINLPHKKIAFADLPKLFQQKLKETENVPLHERRQILSALLETKWNKAEAARKLHWSRMTLYRKINRYHIIEQRSSPR